VQTLCKPLLWGERRNGIGWAVFKKTIGICIHTHLLSFPSFVFQLQDPPDYRDSPVSGSQEHDRDRVELIKLPSHSSNGAIALNIPSFASSTPETEAPLNLSLKPQQSSSTSSTGSNSAQKSSLSSLSSLSASLGTPGMTPAVTERTCKPTIYLVPRWQM
jgi:hypothetical protein